ncbi:hypothetical protein FV219_00905 [Methylobacterium sp. WL122]|nr:hypothetical protein FV219_00905 [Methylobacterium sp. WL122]
MLDELRAIFLFTADLVMLGAGSEAAKQFIGFDRYDVALDAYCDAPIGRVDLGRFTVTHRFEDAYEFAFRPSLFNKTGFDEISDLISFMHAVPRSGGVGASEVHHQYMTPEGLCHTTIDLAWARLCLDNPKSFDDRPLTTRQLALLANMSEGAVRNALADKGENGLRAIPGSKPVAVEHEEARRWLKGRRGFVPSPDRVSEDFVVTERLSSLRTAKELGLLIHQCILIADPKAYKDLVEANEAWMQGTFVFDPAAASELAAKLDLDVPLFVGKALEISLRRDAANPEVRS